MKTTSKQFDFLVLLFLATLLFLVVGNLIRNEQKAYDAWCLKHPNEHLTYTEWSVLDSTPKTEKK